MTREELISYVLGLSDQTLIAAIAIVLVLLLGLIWFVVSKQRLSRRIRLASEDENAADAVVRRLKEHPTPRLCRHALEQIPDRALFTVFRAAIGKTRSAEELLRWMDESDDFFVYRRLALSGSGESFDGAKALELFSDHLDRIREMTGDPEWPARYFAVKILIHDSDARSKRTVREMWDDSHTLIRRTLIEEYLPSETPEEPEGDTREELYSRLFSFVTDDPAFEVRKTAKERIIGEFTDRYEPDYSKMSSDQILHHIELYQIDSTEDIRSALSFLKEDDLELRFAAARFLEKAGTLDSLFTEVEITDTEAMERSGDLLRKAAEVHCSSFLEKTKENGNLAGLIIAADILYSYGDETFIADLAALVFTRSADTPEERKLLEKTLLCIQRRGGEEAVRLMVEELKTRREKSEDAGLFLEHITAAYPFVSVPVLLRLLEEESFTEREKLHEAFLHIAPSYYLSELFSILKADRKEFAHSVRISALILLGKLKLSYCMQFLLEQLPILPFEEAREFSTQLKEYNAKLFQSRVLELLEKNDGKVKAALISAVPATGVKDFLKPIREAVGDADPEVRRAAVWALLEYGDQRSIKSSLDLLRDPVERVRTEAAKALGSGGNASILDSFSELLTDLHEVESVKQAAVEGLAASKEPKSVDLLVKQLERDDDTYYEAILDALSRKSEGKLVKSLIGHMKDAEPELRDRITEAMRRMGEAAEAPLLELLREDIASLSPHIAYVLEETGYVEHTVRLLKHRDAEVRRDAAEVLSRIGTTAAFRGIVLASRDPDEDVRVMVTRALERLNTESGNEILEKLKNDPEKRIRKYTLWAMERIDSKNSEE